jgi:hypothetical protein
MNTNKTFLLDYAPSSFALRLIWEWFTDPIGFVMTRKMLLGIKQRVEASPGHRS